MHCSQARCGLWLQQLPLQVLLWQESLRTPQPASENSQPAPEGSQPESMGSQPASECSQVLYSLVLHMQQVASIDFACIIARSSWQRPVQEQDVHAESIIMPLAQQQDQQPTDEVLKAQADVAAAALHQLSIQQAEQAGDGAETGKNTRCILLSGAAKMAAPSPEF